MRPVKLFLLAIGCGVLALAAGYLLSAIVYPIPHRVIGPVLAITAFVIARQWPGNWLMTAIAVVLPFAIAAPFGIWMIQDVVAEQDWAMAWDDYTAMLSPIPVGFLGGVLGRLSVPRASLHGDVE